MIKKMEEEELKKIKNFSKKIRKNILDMAHHAGASSSHFGGALSIAEIVSFLFSYKMKIDKQNPKFIDRDRFILSKGHACLAYYAALSEVGYIAKEELKTFEKNNSNLFGHPVANKELGIDFSNGSLGMGLSLGIGLCIASKKKNFTSGLRILLILYFNNFRFKSYGFDKFKSSKNYTYYDNNRVFNRENKHDFK